MPNRIRQTPLFEVAMVAALVFAILAVAVSLLGAFRAADAQTVPNPPRWVFEPPPKQSGLDHEFAFVSTIIAQVGVPHDLCWFNPVNLPTSTKEETKLQLAYKRYRLDGGPIEFSEVLPYSKWIPEKTSAGAIVPRRYCTKSSGLPKVGHYVFEAQICRIPYVSDEASCSSWMPSIRPYATGVGGGTVQGGISRGWWIYAYDGSLSTTRT